LSQGRNGELEHQHREKGHEIRRAYVPALSSPTRLDMTLLEPKKKHFAQYVHVALVAAILPYPEAM
jgi:DNA-binding transcriptional ArsR family regulator